MQGAFLKISLVTTKSWALAICAMALAGTQAMKMPAQEASPGSFAEAVKGVEQYSPLIVLKSPDGQALIAVSPAMQGRVFTSSASGPGGHSFGWINQELIASGKTNPHFQAVGGEDRLWLGPEGGQFALYFAKGAPFDLAHWYTPPPFNSEAFDLTGQTGTSVRLRKIARFTNYSGTEFETRIDREVRLLSSRETWSDLKVAAIPGVKVVAFESENTLTNVSDRPWKKQSGLLSIWILGQFQVSPQTTIILPFRKGSAKELGKPVTTDYFGTVPADRIQIGDGHVFFKADANYRSKLGLSPQRARGIIGSYDAQNHVLTIVQFTMQEGVKDYVNSAWKLQDEPYRGDVTNCYNDGPPTPGQPQMGRFYELESSSPALELAPNQSVKHIQRTIHLVGSPEQLDLVARAALGVSLEELKSFTR